MRSQKSKKFKRAVLLFGTNFVELKERKYRPWYLFFSLQAISEVKLSALLPLAEPSLWIARTTLDISISMLGIIYFIYLFIYLIIGLKVYFGLQHLRFQSNEAFAKTAALSSYTCEIKLVHLCMYILWTYYVCKRWIVEVNQMWWKAEGKTKEAVFL